MLAALGYSSMDAFIADSVPKSIRIEDAVVSDESIRPYSDAEFLRRATEIAGMNKIYKTYIGMGYNEAVVPGVILRNVSPQQPGQPSMGARAPKDSSSSILLPAVLFCLSDHREPRVVHVLHAVPARDLAGSARVVDQLPVDGHLFDWTPLLERQSTRRGNSSS